MSDLINKKIVAAELARLIYNGSDDETTMDKLAEQLSVSLKKKTQTAPSPTDEKIVSQNDTVGIWKRENKNGEIIYSRDPKMKKDWIFWAQIPIIPPKKDKKRIVMLGESVARGYLYDPYYYPAQVLDQILNESGLLNSEIIDLARTNLDLTSLNTLTQECLQLEPDAIIIFAGNNWFYSIRRSLTKFDLLEMGKKLDNEGLAGLQEFILDKFKSATKNYLDFLSDISKSKNIPVFFIMPEFNLLDWKSSENERILTALPNDKLRDWAQKRNEANKALLADDLDLAHTLAKALIEIDISNPIGYELAASCELKKGMYEEACKNLEAARDTSIFTRTYSKPRSYAIIRQTLLQEAANYDINIIDMPSLFSDYANGTLPGRDLFLDYCHLTEEGIQITMTATASLIIEKLTGKTPGAEAVDATRFKPDENVRAVAYICAAVHNAHYGQTHDVLNYLCDIAAKSSPLGVEIMSSFVDFASRKTTTSLCESHKKLMENEFINQYDGGVGFLHKRDKKVMDIALVNAMIGSLKTAGVNVSEEIENLRKREHGVNNKKVNLLESFYSTSSYDQYPGKLQGYLQARDSESQYFLVADKSAPVKLNITYRTPRRDDKNDKVKIYINDTVLSELNTTEKWANGVIEISADKLIDGLNIVKIVWATTYEFKPSTKKIELDEDYLLNRLYNVYGEISVFTATAN
jgi:hypothetical protein